MKAKTNLKAGGHIHTVTGKPLMRKTLFLATVLLATQPLGVARATSTCSGGRFLVEGEALVTGQGAPAQDAIVMTDSFISIGSGCGAVSPGFRALSRGTAVSATWEECREPRRAFMLRAELDPTCTTLTGTFGSDRRKARRHFVARLSTCGDGVFDADNSEECDDGNAIAGDGCEVDCTMSPTTSNNHDQRNTNLQGG